MNEASDPVESEKQIDTTYIPKLGINSEIWDDVFSKFYEMKYEIFLNTFENVYKWKLPFTHNGKDYNSKNMIKALRIHSGKIRLK